MNSLENFINVALEQAQKSPITSKKFGAILIHRNRVISKAFNYYKTRISTNNSQCIL